MIDCVCGIETNDTASLEPLSSNDLFKHGLSIVKQLLSLFSHSFVIENFRVCTVRVLSAYLPRLEEWVPVNEGKQ